MEQARPDSTRMPTRQIEAEHTHDVPHGRDARVTQIPTVPHAVSSAAVGVDPIFAAIEAAREAERYIDDTPEDDASAGSPESRAHDEEMCRRTKLSDAAHRAVFDIMPATPAGLMALADFAVERQEALKEWEGGPDVLGTIRAGVAMHLGSVREIPGPDPVFAVLERFRVMCAEYDASPNKGAKFGTPEDETREAETAALAEAENEAWSDLINAEPTSLAGLHAKIRFMGAEYERFWNEFEHADVFDTISEAVAALMGPGTISLSGNPEVPVLVSTGPGEDDTGGGALAAVPPVAVADPGADVALLNLGRRFDEAHATWRRMRDAVRASGLHETPEELAAFESISPWCEAIAQHPTSTVAGLAVRARAALFKTWPAGDYADLLKEEADQTDVLKLIGACCAAAGTDTHGDPVGEGAVEAVKTTHFPHPAILASAINFDGISLFKLTALHQTADLVCDVATAVACQPRCVTSRPMAQAPLPGDLE